MIRDELKCKLKHIHIVDNGKWKQSEQKSKQFWTINTKSNHTDREKKLLSK